jgi:glycine cleavage system H protein
MSKRGSLGVILRDKYHIPEDYYYTNDHEWVKVEKKIATVGITDYAQKKLREVIYVELPNVNTKVQRKQTLASVESVKASADVYAPLSGKVIEVNTKLIDSPEIINESPYEDGWLVKLEISDESELNFLMDADEYARYLEELEEAAEEE